MIKAFIVDDEEWIRMGLKEQIRWEELGIGIVGEASNGEAAIELMEKECPDIMVTDIRMPVLDGIGLMEYVYENHPDIIMIAISGYSEFEYARKAIAFNVFDFVLKPIEEEKLEETLRKAVNKLCEDRRKKEEYQRLRARLNESSSLARDKFLMNLVTRQDISLREIRNSLENYGLEFTWPKMLVIVFRAANFTTIASSLYENDIECAGFALGNVLGDLIEGGAGCLFFRNLSKQNEFILIKGYDIAYTEIEDEIHTLCRTVIDTVKTFIHFQLYIGIGREVTLLQETCKSYEQALEAVQCAGMLPGGILHIDELNERKTSYIYREDKEKTLLYYMENTYRNQALDLIASFFAEVEDNPALNPKSIRAAVLGLATSMNKVLKPYNCLLEDLLHDYSIHDYIIHELVTLGELQKWLQDAAVLVMNYIADNRKTASRKTMDEIVEYLQQHYCENINLNSVADRFFINSTYLSRAFKNETGHNFNDFLSKIRMETALKLLQDENLRMVDISTMVGYENTNYFLRKFKEHFGYTPSEYRKGFC